MKLIFSQTSPNFNIPYCTCTHRAPRAAILVTDTTRSCSRRSKLSSSSFFVPYVAFALNLFLFSVSPPKKSVNLTVNLLLLLFHPHPHPRLLLFVPYYTYVSVMMQLQVTLRRQRILVVRTGHPVGDFSARYRYCSGRVRIFSLPVLL